MIVLVFQRVEQKYLVLRVVNNFLTGMTFWLFLVETIYMLFEHVKWMESMQELSVYSFFFQILMSSITKVSKQRLFLNLQLIKFHQLSVQQYGLKVQQVESKLHSIQIIL